MLLESRILSSNLSFFSHIYGVYKTTMWFPYVSLGSCGEMIYTFLVELFSVLCLETSGTGEFSSEVHFAEGSQPSLLLISKCQLYIYIYHNIYIYIIYHEYIHTYIYIHTHVCIYIYTHTCVYMYIYSHGFVRFVFEELLQEFQLFPHIKTDWI